MLETLFIIAIIASAIVFHEYAHGWVAFKCGDSTAKMSGRLTLNPIKHIDPFGSIILPGALIILRSMGVNIIPIGWAKPVPVNFMRLNNPKRDMIWVGLAGPAINIALAIGFSQLIRFQLTPVYYELLTIAIFINLLLAVFNMIPIPPLDGSRLVMGLLPSRYALFYSRLEKYGIIIVFLLLPLGLLTKVVFPIVTYFGLLLGVNF